MEHLKNQLIEKYPFAKSGVIQQLNYNDAINAILLIQRDPDKLAELNHSLQGLVDLMYTNQPLFNYTEYARYPNIQKSLAIINSTMKHGGANNDIELTSLLIGIIVAIVIMVGIGMTWMYNSRKVAPRATDFGYKNANDQGYDSDNDQSYKNVYRSIISNTIDVGKKNYTQIYNECVKQNPSDGSAFENARFLARFVTKVSFNEYSNNGNSATIDIIKDPTFLKYINTVLISTYINEFTWDKSKELSWESLKSHTDTLFRIHAHTAALIAKEAVDDCGLTNSIDACKKNLISLSMLALALLSQRKLDPTKVPTKYLDETETIEEIKELIKKKLEILIKNT
jgi:hypothetical protein